jgi:hypothetical protein
MALTTKQRLELSTALLSAFPKRAHLNRLFFGRIGRPLDEIAGEGPMRDVVIEVIQTAEAEGWTRDLVNGAVAENPGNELLESFYDTSWIALDTPKRSALETIIRKGVEFLDVDPWIDLLMQMSRRVCRIEVETQVDVGFGTGFLLGRPNVVITNYHVLAPAIAKQLDKPGPQGRLAEPGKVRLRFDYRKLPDGSVNNGKVYALHQNWLLDWSPMSDADISGTGTVANDELDYALVQLATPAGDDPVPQLGSDSARRKWIDLPVTAVALAEGAPLSILQHPEADHLKLALESNAVVNVTPTRVQYRTNTLGGSSGSPCFTQKWELAALHHRGDPKYPNLAGPTNQGIPFGAILALMKTRGTDRHLVSPPPTERVGS